MTENFFSSLEQAPAVADPWTQTQNIIEQVKSALSDGEHDTEPLLEGIVNPKVRDALLMYVITEGNEDVMRDALYGEGTLVSEALDTLLYGPDGPDGLADEALRYLEEYVYLDANVFRADDDAKAQLYALAAVLAFWKNDEDLTARCLDGAETHGSNNLANLVGTAVARGIRPAWVTQ